MYKAVLFDLDGTLMDTSRGVIKSVEYTVDKLGLEKLSTNELLSFIGPPIYNSLKSRYNMTESEAKKATEIFRNVYKDKFLLEADVYDGVFQILDFLRDKKIKIGVATYKREDYALRLLQYYNVSDYCDVIHGADFDNKLSKSDIINLCIREMKINNPREVILVGDTEHDAIGALSLGVNFVGVTFGFGFKSVDEVNKYSNMAVLNKMSELINYI